MTFIIYRNQLRGWYVNFARLCARLSVVCTVWHLHIEWTRLSFANATRMPFTSPFHSERPSASFAIVSHSSPIYVRPRRRVLFFSPISFRCSSIVRRWSVDDAETHAIANGRRVWDGSRDANSHRMDSARKKSIDRRRRSFQSFCHSTSDHV